MQGETDAEEGHSAVYAASLKGLLTQLSEDLERKDVNFVIGRLSDFDTKGKYSQHWEVIREAQMQVATEYPRGAWVNTDDLNDGVNSKGKKIANDLHYSVEGYEILGKRFADAAIELIKANRK